MNMDHVLSLLEHHMRNRFMLSTLFHEFVPKQRLTKGRWFDYMRARWKASWEDALRGYLKGMILEGAQGKVPVERCLERSVLGNVL